MSRRSLYEKLSQREDFLKLTKKIKSLDNKKKYIQDTFNVSSSVADRFLLELHVDKSKLDVEVNTNNKDDIKAYAFISQVESDMAKSPSTSLFEGYDSKLDKFNIYVLSRIFSYLCGKEDKLRSKNALVRSIKYLIQGKYYNVMLHRDMPSYIVDRMNKTVEVCLHDDTIN